jgi:hypothetical protein
MGRGRRGKMSASETWTVDGETDEQFLTRVRAERAKRKADAAAAAEAAKPKLIAAIPPKMADAIKANPTSLRLSVRAEDETVVVDRPRRTEVIEVMDEPTVDGRLRRAWRTDCATGERSVIEFEGGYRQPNLVAHVYDPFAALKGSEND